MKKTTRILLFSAVTAASFGAQAQSGQELIVVAKDAEGTAIGEASVSTASRLCFSEKGVEVVSGEVLSAVFDYSALQTISFRYDNLSGLESISSKDALRLLSNPVAENLEFSGAPEGASLIITDVAGKVRTRIQDWKGEAVNVASFAPGLYFVTVNHTTLKFIKK